MYDLKESGMRIKELRKKAGITQEQLAEELGVTNKTICYIENGVRGTTIDNMALIAEYFGVSIDYLVHGKETVDPIGVVLLELDAEKRALALRLFKGIVENL